jgi:hypothetical protein
VSANSSRAVGCREDDRAVSGMHPRWSWLRMSGGNSGPPVGSAEEVLSAEEMLVRICAFAWTAHRCAFHSIGGRLNLLDIY